MQTENNMLVGEVPAGVGADASTLFRGVEGSDGVGSRHAIADGCGRRYLATRIDTVRESICEAKNFVVSKAGIEGGLDDDIGRRIGRVGAGRVVAVACA